MFNEAKAFISGKEALSEILEILNPLSFFWKIERMLKLKSDLHRIELFKYAKTVSKCFFINSVLGNS
jgi:hypothetical protein